MSEFMLFALPVAYLSICGFIGYAVYKWPELRLRRDLRYTGYRQEKRGVVVLEFDHRNGTRREYRGCSIREVHGMTIAEFNGDSPKTKGPVNDWALSSSLQAFVMEILPAEAVSVTSSSPEKTSS